MQFLNADLFCSSELVGGAPRAAGLKGKVFVSISNSLAHYLQPFQLLNHVHRHVHVVNVHVTCDNVWHQQLTGTLQETYSLHKQN